MHIAMVGPIAGDDIRRFLHDPRAPLPAGYRGAPLTSILIGELLRLGHQVTGITTDSAVPAGSGSVQFAGPSFNFVICPARPHAWRFNGSQPGRVLDFFAFERRQIAAAIAAATPDIVHAHWTYEFALAALSLPLPHLITCHDLPAVVLRYTRSPYRALRYLMARQVFRRGRHFTTVSDYLALALASVLDSSPTVIPNPVSHQVLALGRPRPAAPSRRVAMVCNGWDRRKNAETALRAFALWRASAPTAELHLFGADFGAGETAERWALSQGLGEGLHFRGRLAHAELIPALDGMDALLHPSLEESFGVVLAEAMALGLPVIGGRYSGAVPWVMGAGSHGESDVGVLTDVRSADSMVLALERVFDCDYPVRSAAGLQRARDAYSPLAIAKSYESQYRQILKGSPTGSQQTMYGQPVSRGVSP
jgi:glycosyltransferase involved in cell wall biosynthesis